MVVHVDAVDNLYCTLQLVAPLTAPQVNDAEDDVSEPAAKFAGAAHVLVAAVVVKFVPAVYALVPDEHVVLTCQLYVEPAVKPVKLYDALVVVTVVHVDAVDNLYCTLQLVAPLTAPHVNVAEVDVNEPVLKLAGAEHVLVEPEHPVDVVNPTLAPLETNNACIRDF